MAGDADARTRSVVAPRGVRPARALTRRAAQRWQRGERGAALVELAIVLPLLLMIVFGIVEFGTTYNSYIALRDGVRQAARSGVVGNFGTSSSCELTGVAEASTGMRRLMCLTKFHVGLDATDLRVKVMSANPDFSGAGTFAKNDALIICAQYPINAVTGFLAEALTGKTLQTKVSMRIEKSDISAEAGEEDPPPGRDWSWCTYNSVAP